MSRVLKERKYFKRFIRIKRFKSLNLLSLNFLISIITFAIKDKSLLNSLKNGDQETFDAIYSQLARPLLHYVNSRLHDKNLSEDLVQEVFLSLWTRRAELNIQTSLEAYLFGAAKFQILDYFRSEKVKQKYVDHFILFAAQDNNSVKELMHLKDLQAAIEKHIQDLPPKCQSAFRLSRFEHKTISEIAEVMNISPRTVENYMTKALKHLRIKLAQYPWVLILSLLNNLRS